MPNNIFVTPEELKAFGDRLAEVNARMDRDRVFHRKMQLYVRRRPERELPARVVRERPKVVSIAVEPKHRLVSVKVADAIEVLRVELILRRGKRLLAKGVAAKVDDDTLWIYRLPENAKRRGLTIEATATNVFGNTATMALRA